tara:strand:+ start:444 stop:707 length:264 start_codon:yes stop_codon:yes gene_type:complete
MANHKSAEKRSRQTIKKSKINQIVLKKLKTTFSKLNNDISGKNTDSAQESLRLFNASLSKAVKKGIIKKRNASRKLSSLSNKLKKII